MSAITTPACPRLITPADHALALHPAGRGRVTLARRLAGGSWRETAVPVGDLAYAVRHLGGEHDVYLTQNRFFGPRRVIRLAELDALFVDLDFHRTEHAGAHPQRVLELAVDALEHNRIPHPSFALSTGRGLALVWLHRPVPRAALPRWRACQDVLWGALRSLGADRLATDAARVLRLVGTRNRRSGTLVEALTPVGEVWDFELLADEILPLSRAGIVALRLERAKRQAAGQGASHPAPARWFDAAGLWELRLTELQKLLELRWFGTLPPGQRDPWLLLAGVAISYLVPAVLVRREVVALADQVTGGCWSERETKARMSAVIARAEQAACGERIAYRGRLVDPRYRFETATIVNVLAITEAEMRAGDFRHLVSPEIRREQRRTDQQARRRASGVRARSAYQANSLTDLEPWRTEGISHRTWYRRRGTSLKRCMVAKPSISS